MDYLNSLGAIDAWIIATAVLCAVSCSLLGTFLILRKSALLGDAVSHSILPGIALAFIVTGSRSPGPMLVGSLVAGISSAGLTSVISRYFRVHSDAAMGIVFTSFFALGVILITAVARNIDLDPGCVLYGLLEFTPFDTVVIAGREVPRAFVWLGCVLVVDALFVWIFFKELVLTSFDSRFAAVSGFSPTLVHYIFMALVTATAVASFESVGSILVISMLVTPAAAAYLISKRVGTMVWIAIAIGALSAVLGYLGALKYNTSVAGMMSVISGALFAVALLFSPRQGIVARIYSNHLLSTQIREEDFIAHLYRWGERHDALYLPEETDLLSRIRQFVLIRRLARRGFITKGSSGELALTERGKHEATTLVRSHRLWESYLAKNLNLPADHVHAPSERVEHFTDKALESDLRDEVGANSDPHGKKIP